ncbi:MAG: hypothetical protein NZ772_15160 [Cyanobacteria bacterium]|nr:hypothetical protein [Cyanobacteriota bacterium]MDW8201905.1 hypothetical protein [Cyanobacteriota bacterium SKYGB_h_bin112]
MNSNSEDLLPSLLRQCCPLLLGLLDDGLIVGLSRLGCKIPWLEALSPIVISGTVLYLTIQFCQHGIPNLLCMWQAFRQQAEALGTCRSSHQ